MSENHWSQLGTRLKNLVVSTVSLVAGLVWQVVGVLWVASLAIAEEAIRLLKFLGRAAKRLVVGLVSAVTSRDADEES